MLLLKRNLNTLKNELYFRLFDHIWYCRKYTLWTKLNFHLNAFSNFHFNIILFQVLFRYSLAVFKLFEEEFLRFKDPGPMFNFFRNLPKTKFNIQKICYIAFNTMNPFSRKNVESKRKFYRPILQVLHIFHHDVCNTYMFLRVTWEKNHLEFFLPNISQ